MATDDRFVALQQTLLALFPTPEDISSLLELSGVRTESIDFDDPVDRIWTRALNECYRQGDDALESLLVEVLEKHPENSRIEQALKGLGQRDADMPEAASGGGSLSEAVIRDPLEGTELLIAFAEARGRKDALLVQLKRCHTLLQEIAKSRQRQGKTLKHEKRWKQATYEILDLAHQLEGREDENTTFEGLPTSNR